jgi:hypothetical protein
MFMLRKSRNANCDRLSRRKDTDGLPVADEAIKMGVTGGAVVEMNGEEDIMDLLRLCDPRAELTTELEFITFWTRARTAIDVFLNRHRLTPPPASNCRPLGEGGY